MVWLKFAACLAIILVAGSQLSKYGDALGEKTRLGRVWIGIVLLATVTSMPELATGVSSVTLLGKPDLTLGDLFGSNLINIVIIALLDIVYTKGPLIYYVSTSVIFVATLSAIFLALVATFMYIVQNVSSLSIANYIGLYSPILFGLFLLTQYMLFRYRPAEQENPANIIWRVRYERLTIRKVVIGFSLAAITTVGAGIWLSYIGDEMARVTGLGTTFIGTLFLAAATSAPEIVVSFSAIRLGALDMAVGNALGSNIFNMGVTIFVADLAYTKGPLFSYTTPEHMSTALFGVLMSCIIVTALVFRLRYWSRARLGGDTVLLVGLYVAAIVTLYMLATP
ncbi:sodium:calcium antiporter [Chloroflexota bacterium]